MITCKLRGGLGNQLFQIFTTIAYALKCNTTFIFLNMHQLNNGINGVTIRYTYWNTFLSNLRIFLRESLPNTTFHPYIEPSFAYKELININADIMLIGYFQSSKYFEEYKNTIFRLIKLEMYKALVPMYDNTVSMHFRLGDYLHYPHIYNILGIDYYETALQRILAIDSSITTVLYFCETNDRLQVQKIIGELHHTFPHINFIMADNEYSDWEQMLMMSKCTHNIIANSTFSWWGAYFNENPNKMVTFPMDWYKNGTDISDLYVDGYIQI